MFSWNTNKNIFIFNLQTSTQLGQACQEETDNLDGSLWILASLAISLLHTLLWLGNIAWTLLHWWVRVTLLWNRISAWNLICTMLHMSTRPVSCGPGWWVFQGRVRHGKTYKHASNACVKLFLARVKSVPNFTLYCHKIDLC